METGHNCHLCKKAKCFSETDSICLGNKNRGKIISEDDTICDEYEFGGFIELSERILKIPYKVNSLL